MKRLSLFILLLLLICAVAVGMALFYPRQADQGTSEAETPMPEATVETSVETGPLSITATEIPAESDKPSRVAETPSTDEASFDRATMVANILNYAILPANKRFVAQSTTLRDAIAHFEADPTVDSLVAVQEAWRDTSDAWAECELFSTQRLMLIHNAIDKWPTNIDFIEGFINGQESLDEAFLNGIGATSKGLPAIEYLIFDPAAEAGPDAVVARFIQGENADRRRQYLLAAGENLLQKAHELNRHWLEDQGDGSGTGLAHAFLSPESYPGGVQGLIELLVNTLTEQLEDNYQQRLWGIVQQQMGMAIEVESPFAHHSIAQLQHSINGFQRALTGGPEATDLGLDDYLDYLNVRYTAELMSSHVQTPTPDHEGEPLSAVLKARVDELQHALADLEEPLDQAIRDAPDGLQEVHTRMLRLLIPVRVDMTNQFGVTLQFNDGD